MAFGPALVMSINGLAMIVISTLGILERLGGWRTIQLLVPIPVVVWIMLKLGTTIRARFRLVQAAFGTVSDRVNENINGIRVIKAYVQEDEEVQKFNGLSEDMAELIATVRMLAFEARAAEEEVEDWDEEFEDGPEIIYAYGEGDDDDDEIE